MFYKLQAGCIFSLVTLTFDLDLQTRPSEGPIKHFFHVNLAQIRSAVPDIFHTQKPQTDGAKNRTFRSLLLAVRMPHKDKRLCEDMMEGLTHNIR